MCSQHKDGTYVRSFVLPGETPLPNAAISDTGKLVKYLTEHGDEYHKRTVAFNSQSISESAKLEVLQNGKRETSRSYLETVEVLTSLSTAYNIPARYEQTPQQDFRNKLEAVMGPVTALDFTEQLMIFEACGMIYDHPDFIQASQVSRKRLFDSSRCILTSLQLPGLQLKTWQDFVRSNDLLSLMKEV